MRNQFVEMPVKSVPVRQIIATTSEWIHALGSDESLYIVPAVPRNYSDEHAYSDSAVLNALGIATLDAEVLSLSHNLAVKAGFAIGKESNVVPQQVIGWRLPKERADSRLFQVLPLSWLPRVTNREQFLEVLILDLWFRRSRQRQVVFRQTGQEIEAIFLPAGDLVGTQKCKVQQVGYHQAAVYNGLARARIEAGLKAKIASLTLSDLRGQLRMLPRIGVGHEVLKSLWFETMVNKVCFDQCLTDAMGPLFGGVVHTNHERPVEVSANRLRIVSHAGPGYSMGRYKY